MDEGTLHALIDGALRADAPERAAEVRAHLAACEDCRARLEAVEELRDDAAGILDAAAPPAAAVAPDFEDVVARAPGRGTSGTRAGLLRRQARWTRSLAWAASLVLALGTGYLIRDLGGPGLTEPRTDPVESLETADAAPDRAAERALEGDAAGRVEGAAPGEAVERPAGGAVDRGEPQRERAADAPTGPPPVAAPAPRPEPTSAGEAPTPAGVGEGERAPDQAAQEHAGEAGEESARVLAEPQLSLESLVADSLAARSLADRAISEPLVEAAPATVGMKGVEEERTRNLSDAVRWSAITLDEARKALDGPLYLLPRAELLEIYALADAAPARVMTVQRLQTGVPVQVVQWRGAAADAAEAAERAAPAPAPADRPAPVINRAMPEARVVRVVQGRYVLELTASLPPALLSVLGETATPAR